MSTKLVIQPINTKWKEIVTVEDRGNLFTITVSQQHLEAGVGQSAGCHLNQEEARRLARFLWPWMREVADLANPDTLYRVLKSGEANGWTENEVKALRLASQLLRELTERDDAP